MLIFTSQPLPVKDVCIICMDDTGQIFVYARYSPINYDFDMESDEATNEEKDYVKRCIEQNKWLNE